MTRAAFLVSETNLFDFFRERVETAVQHQRAPVSENAVYYLSNLLTEQARRAEEEVEDDPPTLVELQHRAVHAPHAEAVTLWRRLGDSSLVVSGFFRESLERRAISRDYYERMGSTAYRALERLMGGHSFGEIFAELGDRYHACVEVLAEVRDETRERTDSDILKLYEEWLATGSPRVAERLKALGVVPVRVVGQG
jgi:predicted CopG family antitoxin